MQEFLSGISDIPDWAKSAFGSLGVGLIILLLEYRTHWFARHVPAIVGQVAPRHLENVICQKAEAEFQIAKRDFDRLPISKEHLTRIQENIDRNYSPFAVLDRSVDIRIDIFIMPLINTLIKIESELRARYRIPFTPKRIATLKEKISDLVTENLPHIVTASYDDAIKHVKQHTGQLFDYKKAELDTRRDELLNTRPNGLFEIIDERLRNALADSILLATSSSPAQ